MTQPTTRGDACRVLAEAFGMERAQAQRALGAGMLDGLVNAGYVAEDRRTDWYALTQAGRRLAQAHNDPMKDATDE